jgi:hypothetical protein
MQYIVGTWMQNAYKILVGSPVKKDQLRGLDICGKIQPTRS